VNDSVVFSTSGSLRWVKEASSILLVDEQRHKTYTLQGIEAAVWSWLTLAYPYPKLVTLTAALLALPPEEAEQQLWALLAKWHSDGILEKKEGGHG
jgi:hypothetical protein